MHRDEVATDRSRGAAGEVQDQAMAAGDRDQAGSTSANAAEHFLAPGEALPCGIRFGSHDSIDCDTVHPVDRLPGLEECKALCAHPTESRNLVVIRNGVVADCFKGLPDETNNALFHTFHLHEQQRANPVTRTVTRIVPLKVVRAIRIVLSHLSRTNHREAVREALRSRDMARRIETLSRVRIAGLDLPCDVLKSITFQLVQTIALVDGKEIYTKHDARSFAPEVADLLDRRPGVPAALDDLRDRLLDRLRGVYFRTKGDLQLFMYGNALAIRDWNLFARQSRGMIIDMRRERCVAFPMDKFFRFGEGPELSREALPADTPVEIVEKVDGSMVSLIAYDGRVAFVCKGNFDTPQSRRAAGIATRLPIARLETERYFHVFEVIYPENRFPQGLSIVDYGPREDLVLTAMRDRQTNDPLAYDTVIATAQRVGISHPRVFPRDLAAAFHAVDAAPRSLHDEGFVIRSRVDGRLFKLKYPAYSDVLRMVNEMRTGRFVRAHLDLDSTGREESLRLLPADIRDVAEQHLARYRCIVDHLLGFLAAVSAAAPVERRTLAEYIQHRVPLELQSIAFRYHRHGPSRVSSALEEAALEILEGKRRMPE